MPETEEEKTARIVKIIEGWPKDCPNRPTLAQALLHPEMLHDKAKDPGIATLTSGLGTVELYHIEKPRETLPAKFGESEIFGKHGDIMHYGGDKSDRLDLIGFIDAESEYTALKSTLKTMRQGQGANPIAVTVRFGASAYINGINYWVGDIEIDPEPGIGVFFANYRIPCIKRD